MAALRSKTSSLLICFTVVILNLASISSKAELQRLKHAPKADGSLSFLVVGDWGRRGNYNQSLVATQMGKIGEKVDIDFVISTGDNFYEDGLKGVEDPTFAESFSRIYTAPSLQKKWYNENVEFFFVDTTPFVTKYFTEPKDHVHDWRGVLPRKLYRSKLLKEVDLALRKSSATWRIVIGHHTIRSAGHHSNTEKLAMQLLPLLQGHNVDMYINGHDHCLEHISSLERSKAWRGDVKRWKAEEMKFYYDGQGFMFVQITQTLLEIAFFDVFGNVLHRWNTSKQLHPFTV